MLRRCYPLAATVRYSEPQPIGGGHKSLSDPRVDACWMYVHIKVAVNSGIVMIFGGSM
jgi:hypothetical protein